MSAIHKPTLRTLSVLELLSKSDQNYTLSEISRRLGMATSTLYPILQSLRDERYLGYDKKTQSYTLGMRMFEVGSRVQNSSAFQEINNIMSGVVGICDETCIFGKLDNGDVLYLSKVESNQPVRMFCSVGKRLPAYSTALGKALLKGYSVERLKKLYPNGLKPLTVNTITDFKKLHEQLNENDIFLYEREESNKDICCVAVPIHLEGSVVAACSVATPVFRFNSEKRAKIENALKEALVKYEKMIHYMFLD